ncbi:sodium-coupled neutral amino acid transporter 9 homolog isoform X1 [Artemia franciscana]|uniref:sodium-coupled neutral amino acid transporter 9 homolog isoform X1 n=1 Tax=Artemia franciscana TaxID=6661 RepID=UPI0032DA586D
MITSNMNESLLPSSPSRVRQPYHYDSLARPSIPQTPPLDEEAEDPGPQTFPPVEPTYSRYRYYSKLIAPGSNEDALRIPLHVIPVHFLYPMIPGVIDVTAGKQSSLVTIFAIWNTMMGTSLLTMPWALEQAGLVLGLCLMVSVAGICFYTAWRILSTFKFYEDAVEMLDFPDLCRHILGKAGEWTSVAFSGIALLGASIVYWVLMSNFLYNTGKVIHDVVVGNFSSNETDQLLCPHPSEGDRWSKLLNADLESFSTYWSIDFTVPIYLTVILGPLTCLKSATFFTKFNAFGNLNFLSSVHVTGNNRLKVQSGLIKKRK